MPEPPRTAPPSPRAERCRRRGTCPRRADAAAARSPRIAPRPSRGRRALASYTRSSQRFFSASATSTFSRRIFGVEDVLHADAEPHRLVGVAGADAPLRRADCELAETPLARLVDREVPRHDQVGVARDADLVGRATALREIVELGDQHLRVDDAAVADHARLAADDPARECADLVRLVADDDRVAGVRAALVAADDVGVLGEQVDDLALPLVTPLRADDDGRRHGRRSMR